MRSSICDLCSRYDHVHRRPFLGNFFFLELTMYVFNTGIFNDFNPI